MKKAFPIIFNIFVFINLSVLPVFSQQDEWKPSGKVWGYAFGDFYYKTGGTATPTWGKMEFAKKKKEDYAFSLRRIYLGYDYNISPVFSTSLILESGNHVTDASGRWSVFLKSCHLKWKKLIPRSELRFGLVPAPAWATFTEGIWNYRSLEKTIADSRGISRAVDAGIALAGTLDSAANFGYSLLYGNGKGSIPEDLRLKVFYGELYGHFLKKKLIFHLFTEYEPAKKGRDKMILKEFIGYRTGNFTIGLELVDQFWYQSSLWDSVASDIISSGVSLFAHATIIKDKLNAVGRVDFFDNDFNSRDTVYKAVKLWDASKLDYTLPYSTDYYYLEGFAMFALDYTPHKNVHLMPNIWINGYFHKPEMKAAPRRSDVVPRITFYYVFR